jgi:hypothetical protein
VPKKQLSRLVCVIQVTKVVTDREVAAQKQPKSGLKLDRKGLASGFART